MITAALDTGMRRGEITSQIWEDVDFAQRVLFVTRSKTPEGESREIPLTEPGCLSGCLENRASRDHILL
jgi:integrase